MNDINWRDLDQGFSIYDHRNASRSILCKDVTGEAWITTCNRVDGYLDNASLRYIYFYTFI